MKSSDKKEINVNIGENIRKYRTNAGYSREKFAELIGITARFLADVENGFTGISMTTLRCICETLGISSDRILWQTENKLGLDERVSHVNEKYIPLIENMLQNQLEIIAIANNEENAKRTRR